jgi:pimeloyl-ACP methyl ester carboxylesterase
MAAVPLIRAAHVVGHPARLPDAPGRLVDIGGQRIHLDCTGSGSPTVVFENGAGDFSVVWSLVQPGVSGFTRACSYDRAGYAWSDPGQTPRTYEQIALELFTAL